ncbi:LysR family transcriptional regulator [Corticibacter populi]|uniref:LysR family transcriptional regulator n=1 Tax=Corticibacter populi TaxID=1550736 RepID=A0A3M6QVQ3_9BURK|nr:LysR substrate-binding domain-containing protein [Corticibacter populi]RMX06649.1 LysR family transcriptional regulator [Corticibacter populi]RZS31779.1 DNA-binding transcriptional LysR family regulator [Corticibacter populi]
MDWTDRLRLRNLQMLLSLAHTGNMSQSALALNTTQPALSKWLKELEEDMGLQLFERHARGLRPTPHGEALIAHARRINAHLDSARDDMQALREGGHGLVVLGTSGASASDLVPGAVLHLLERLPQTRIRLMESTMNVLMQQLATGELDVVVGRTAPELQEAVTVSETLYMEPIHLVARPQHPLFARDALDWPDLMQYRWLVWPKGTPIRNTLENALAAAGQVLPRGHIESNSVTLNLTLINSSDMIGLASHRAAVRFSQLGGMRIVPLKMSGFGTVSMYWRQGSTNRIAVAAMLSALRQAVGSG